MELLLIIGSLLNFVNILYMPPQGSAIKAAKAIKADNAAYNAVLNDLNRERENK